MEDRRLSRAQLLQDHQQGDTPSHLIISLHQASGFVLDSYKCNEVGENPGGFAGGFIKTWYDVNTPCQQWLFVPV